MPVNIPAIRLTPKKPTADSVGHDVNEKRIFKDYRLKKPLGEGSFGKVYLVENALGAQFALKVLHRNISMEKRGLEAVMKIRSNRLVKLIDYGKTSDQTPCVLMEYIPCSLEDELRQQTLSKAQARRYFEEILEILKVLESHRIIHRDIKPANMFIAAETIKIGDFSTAKYLPENNLTMSDVAGTFHFMAPERFQKNYGFSVDRWAAAIIFYRMLTGKYVFDGNDRTQIFGSILMSEPDLSPLPPEYRDYFARCFRKNPKDRHAQAEEMRLELALIPKSSAIITTPAVSLRTVPRTVSEAQFQAAFNLNQRRRPVTFVKNNYRDNHNGTITDQATGCVWQQAGSLMYLPYQKAPQYLNQLNQTGFGGSHTWRLPTVDELLSLMEPQRQSNGLFIAPIFDHTQQWCWSADRRDANSAWIIFFDKGNVYWNSNKFICFVRAVYS